MPYWPKLFSSVCGRVIVKLRLGMQEQWPQVELFAAFCREADVFGWKPLETKVPYPTYYPVMPPKSANFDWRRHGAKILIGLFFRDEPPIIDSYLNVKGHHAGFDGRESEAAKLARDAFVKDSVGLLGLDLAATSHLRRDPDEHAKANWFEEQLAPLSD